MMSHSRGGRTYIPDGGSFYDFAGASKVGSAAGTTALVIGGIDSLFDISKQTAPQQDFMFGSVLSGGTNPQQAANQSFYRDNNNSNSRDISGISSGAAAPFLTSSALLDFSSVSSQRGGAAALGDGGGNFTKTDAETGESIVLRSVEPCGA